VDRGAWSGLCVPAPIDRLECAPTAALAVLDAVRASVKLVVLNACDSRAQSAALVPYTDCVVGFDGPTGDYAAHSFVTAFYRCLGASESVTAAFKQGHAAVLKTVRDNARPRLEVRDGIDASQMVPIARRPARPTASSSATEASTEAAAANTTMAPRAASSSCPDLDPDHDVMSFACRGEQDRALRLLMERHGRDVYRFCVKMVRDRTLAEDVHQQVFISAHRDLLQFSGRSTIRSWLFGIARNRALDALRCRARQGSRRADLDEIAAVLDPRPPATEAMDRRRLLETALASLEETARNVILLRFGLGMSFDEMARDLDQSAAVLRMRVSRALRQLRVVLEARTECPALTSREEHGLSSMRPQAKSQAKLPAHAKRAGVVGTAMAIAAVALMTAVAGAPGESSSESVAASCDVVRV